MAMPIYRSVRLAACGLAVFGSLITTCRAQEACALKQESSLPVTITAKKKLIVPATINGLTVRAFVDTGSAATMVTQHLVKQMHLGTRDLHGKQPFGIGGELANDRALIRNFEFGAYQQKDFGMVVVPDLDGAATVYDIVVGGDTLWQMDVDIDLAKGLINLFSRDHCEGKVVYWASGALNHPFHLSEIKRVEMRVAVDGHDSWATLDTGSTTTLLSWDAARRIGLTPDSPQLEPAGRVIGFDGKKIQSWGTRIESVVIGAETMKNYPVVIANTKRSMGRPTGSNLNELVDSANVLIGTEFFQINHVYIAYGEEKIYYTPYSDDERHAVQNRIGAADHAYISSISKKPDPTKARPNEG